MPSIRSLIVIKTDQLNSEDFRPGEARTITITGYKITGSAEQPLALYFAGDRGKPFKPCKTMMKVMEAAWGDELDNYVGRSMTLIRDDKVKYGAEAVGGIRVTHMSHISAAISVPVTITRGIKKPYLVKPLRVIPGATISVEEARAALAVAVADGLAALQEAWIALPVPVKKAVSPTGCPADLKAEAERIDRERADAEKQQAEVANELAGDGGAPAAPQAPAEASPPASDPPGDDNGWGRGDDE
jgi:hypothetical protein